MRHLPLDCPHCGTINAGFSGEYTTNSYSDIYLSLFKCGVCHNGVVVRLQGQATGLWINGHNVSAPLVLEVYPNPPKLDIPEHCPDNVEIFYRQGLTALNRRDYDSAGIMFRRTLEASLKKLVPDATGTLFKRISNLPDQLGVTPAMKEWAHAIRELGNDASHDDEPIDQAHAETLQSFTEMFLTYCFEMPGRLAARREATPTD